MKVFTSIAALCLGGFSVLSANAAAPAAPAASAATSPAKKNAHHNDAVDKKNKKAVHQTIQKLTRFEKFLGNAAKNLESIADIKTPVDGLSKSVAELKKALEAYGKDPNKISAAKAKDAFVKVSALSFFKQNVLAHKGKGPGKGNGKAKKNKEQIKKDKEDKKDVKAVPVKK